MSSVACPNNDGLPKYGWRAGFDYRPPVTCKAFGWPRPAQVPNLLKPSMRYIFRFYMKRRFTEKKRPFIDCFERNTWKPIYGVPLGGIGGGTIGRGFKGEFCRYNMLPGMYQSKIVHNNQFVVTVRRHGKVVYNQVLSPLAPTKKQTRGMTSWNWEFPAKNASYVGLYPRSWTIYDLPGQNIRLICRQISPIIPKDYKDSCLPLGLFIWRVINKGDEPVEVTITLTFKNGQGVSSDRAQGVWGQPFTSENLKGCMMHQSFKDMPCTYGLAARVSDDIKVNVLPGFNISKKKISHLPSADDVWEQLSTDGIIKDSSSNTEKTSLDQALVCALSVQCKVEAGQESELEFALTWHMPKIHFRAAEIWHTRRYARWFSQDPEVGAIQLLSHALNSYQSWEEKINAWQDPIFDDSSLPDWYKSAIFNELYFVADGGTIWVDPIEPKDLPMHNNDIKTEIGFFGYLEGHEYRMYNTYDVHYYASWALILLWPKIQLAIQYDIAHATVEEDGASVYYIHNGLFEIRSSANSVPHDLGDPEDEPWNRVNSYIMYNTNEWKDLNPKFVLQVYRDYFITKDEAYLKHMTPIVLDVLRRSIEWDTDGDGIIDNSGCADQTYDVWNVSGASAYTGGLWISALYAACQLAEILGLEYSDLKDLLKKANASYHKKLWNGSYYRYDSSHFTTVMADQINGHWYLKASGVSDDAVFPRENVQKALKTIFENNVKRVGKGSRLGQVGAINGFNSEAQKKDISSVQSEEFWVGVSYSLASTLVLEGMVDEAMEVAKGTYTTVYEQYGLQFQTPEAYLEDGRFRSTGYMRPLSIWSIQHALERGNQTILPVLEASEQVIKHPQTNGQLATSGMVENGELSSLNTNGKLPSHDGNGDIHIDTPQTNGGLGGEEIKTNSVVLSA